MNDGSSNASSPFTLAVCAEMVFKSLPVVDRLKRITELGFHVEIWDWTKHDRNRSFQKS